MSAKLRSHLSYANVMATIAVFMALGGGVAWALGLNSVKSKHIKNGQVKSADAANNGLTGTDIAERTLVGVRPYGNRIPAGTTVTGVWGGSSTFTTNIESGDFLVSLPAPAAVPLTAETINFEPDEGNAVDRDPECSGTDDAPTAPAGKVCIYTGTNVGGGPTLSGDAIDGDGSSSDRLGFLIGVSQPNDPALGSIQAHGTWAYTAP